MPLGLVRIVRISDCPGRPPGGLVHPVRSVRLPTLQQEKRENHQNQTSGDRDPRQELLAVPARF